MFRRVDSYYNHQSTKKWESFFKKKWANAGLFFVYFRSFHIRIQLTKIQFELYKLKKHRWYAWDSNPGWQDGRRRQIH